MRYVLILLALTVAVAAYPSKPDERKIVLKGTRNTRELGGIPIQGGTVARGMIYRSGALCFASREDAAKLHGLKIKTFLELRLPQEIAKDGPDKGYLLEKIPVKLHWPMGNSHGLGREAYISYVNENERLFRDYFRLLSQKESYPILYHCSAGKDRTGILTALLLESLGASREVIMDDYIHSRRITPKLKVQEDWIQVVFAAVDRAGGIDGYLRKIGVSKAQQKSIGEILRVPADSNQAMSR